MRQILPSSYQRYLRCNKQNISKTTAILFEVCNLLQSIAYFKLKNNYSIVQVYFAKSLIKTNRKNAFIYTIMDTSISLIIFHLG